MSACVATPPTFRENLLGTRRMDLEQDRDEISVCRRSVCRSAEDTELSCHGVQNSLVQKLFDLFRTTQKDPDKELLSPHRELRGEESMFGENSDWMLPERTGTSPRSSPPPPVSPGPPSSCHKSPGHEYSPYSPGREEGYPHPLDSNADRVRKRLFHHEPFSEPRLLSTSHNPSSVDIHFISPHQTHSQTRRTEAMYNDFHAHEYVFPYLNSVQLRNAKRRIASDDELDQEPSPTKRHKPEPDRQRNVQYLNELRSDVIRLREQLRKPETEVQKPLDCACAVMETQFLEMAESAYRSIRRLDCTPKGFEQFKRELIQTNEVIKESLDVLKVIKRCCEHKF